VRLRRGLGGTDVEPLAPTLDWRTLTAWTVDVPRVYLDFVLTNLHCNLFAYLVCGLEGVVGSQNTSASNERNDKDPVFASQIEDQEHNNCYKFHDPRENVVEKRSEEIL
jgi:hypothetical protein